MEYLSLHISKIKNFLLAHRKSVQIVAVCLFVIISLLYLVLAPAKKEKTNITISNGLSLMQVSIILQDNHVIRSKDIFRAVVILIGREGSIKAGPYLFNGDENVFKIAQRMVNADYGVPVKKITVTEGMRGRDILNLFGPEFTNLKNKEFENELLSREGYLFPDTYFFPLSSASSDIIKMLSDNFDKHILDIDFSKSQTSQDLNEIIAMASIIEGEAKEDNDRKIISDILWRRIEIGMPLQVDTTFMYIMNKPSSEITKSDLKIDSPYNTYVYKGLPPTPISNPGIEAIDAAMHPTVNKYLYYLSDKDGLMHYAVTFEEHKKNKEKYLK